MSRIIIVCGKTDEIGNRCKTDENGNKLNMTQRLDKYRKYMDENGSIVTSQSEYIKLSNEFKLNKNVEIRTSELFSYQGDGNPEEGDYVILVNMFDRYGYQDRLGFYLYEFPELIENDDDYEKQSIETVISIVKTILDTK